MRRLLMIGLGVAAGVVVSAGGSAYAGEAVTTGISPAVHVSGSGGTDYRDDMMGGCGGHRSQSNTTAP